MAAEFVLKLLKKRLFSSPAAFQITLEKHAATVGGGKAVVVDEIERGHAVVIAGDSFAIDDARTRAQAC